MISNKDMAGISEMIDGVTKRRVIVELKGNRCFIGHAKAIEHANGSSSMVLVVNFAYSGAVEMVEELKDWAP